MTTDQFRVTEHYSYDIIGTLVYALTLDPLRNNISKSRMLFFYDLTNTLGKCRQYLFPEFEFNAQEFAKR